MRTPTHSALWLACLFNLSIALPQKGYTQEVQFNFEGKSITGTKSYAQLYQGIIYLGFKTSVGKELTLEIYKNSFPKIPYTITHVSGGEGEQMSKVFYYDNPKSGDPYFATETGTITITAFDPVAKTMSGKFDVSVTRVAFGANKPADYGKPFKISEGVFTNIKIQ